MDSPPVLAPAVFVSHGSPMVAIETGPYQDALAAFGRGQRVRAIVVVSAHWEFPGDIRVGAAANPRLIYDFGGFPSALYSLEYPAPGDPNLAGEIAQRLGEAGIVCKLDPARGLDHGAWVPLRLMFPEAAVPVVPVSLPVSRTPRSLFAVGRALAPLRASGVLVMGSGGIVHNLGRIDFHRRVRPPEPWALAFDTWFRERLEASDIDGLFQWDERAPHATLAAPTTEHFDPVFFTLGAAADTGPVEHIYEGFEYGTLSMRSFALP